MHCFFKHLKSKPNIHIASIKMFHQWSDIIISKHSESPRMKIFLRSFWFSFEINYLTGAGRRVILFSSLRWSPFDEIYWWIIENWANVKSEKTDKTNLPLTNRLSLDRQSTTIHTSWNTHNPHPSPITHHQPSFIPISLYPSLDPI